MGEAKRRGTYEERKAEGERKCAERMANHMSAHRPRGKSKMLALAALMMMAASATTATTDKGETK